MKTQKDILIYEIRVQGYLGKDAAIWFEDFEIDYGSDGETILCGPVVDQAALHGILARIRDLGLTMVLIQQKK